MPTWKIKGYWCYFKVNDLTKNKVNGKYMYELYDNTMKIEKAIKDAGYKLETIWEHDFDNNTEMKNISLSEYDLVEPPNIRDCFYGGRCEPIKLLHYCKSNGQKGR